MKDRSTRQSAAPCRLRAAALAFALVAISGCPAQPAGPVLSPVSQRVAFQSPCAQNAIECTSSWPVAIARVREVGSQIVTETDAGFIVRLPGAHGSVPVHLSGSDSTAGDGATQLSFSWSAAATQDDPCELTPGDEFSTLANPVVNLAIGLHYIRLTVENDIIRDVVESETCGVFGENIPSFDFVELEIDVRN